MLFIWGGWNAEGRVHRYDDAEGFTYEIEETIRCVRAKKTESPVVPHATTSACAELFDQIQAAKKE